MNKIQIKRDWWIALKNQMRQLVWIEGKIIKKYLIKIFFFQKVPNKKFFKKIPNKIFSFPKSIK